MADYYHAEVEIMAPAGPLNLDSDGNLADVERPFKDADVLNEAWTAASFDEVGLIDASFNDDGTMTHGGLFACDSQARYGIVQFDEASLDTALKDAGIGFKMYDNGIYDNTGLCRFWRPGMPEIVERMHNQDGIVMASHHAQALIDAVKDMEPAEAVQKIVTDLTTYFDLQPEVA